MNALRHFALVLAVVALGAFAPAGRAQIAPRRGGDPATVTAATVNPDDLVVFEFGNSLTGTTAPRAGIYQLDRTTGSPTAATVLANSSTGSGVGFDQVAHGIGGPNGLIYYWDDTTTVRAIVSLDPATLARTIVSGGPTGSVIGTGPAPASVPSLAWDFKTGTLLYLDLGNSTVAAGLWRVDPVTGNRTPFSTNPGQGTGAGTGSGSVTFNKSVRLTVDAAGNAYLLNNSVSGSSSTDDNSIVKVAVSTGARTVVSASAPVSPTVGTGTAFSHPFGLDWDYTTNTLVVADYGTDANPHSFIFRVDPTTGNRTVLSNDTAGTTYGGPLFFLPASDKLNSNGRIYYVDVSTTNANNQNIDYLNGSVGTLFSPGPTGAASSYSLNLDEFAVMPPRLPGLGAATATNVTGSGVTLNGSTTSDGGTLATSGGGAAPITDKGFVVSATGTNATPAIGGTGVSQFSGGSGIGAYSVTPSGLNNGTAYSFRAYAIDRAGTSYSAVGNFTTLSPPSVAGVSVSNVTTSSADLASNVTADGGATVTARGFVIAATATNSNPTLGGSGVTNLPVAGTTGSYNTTASGLNNGTGYSVRAYATNSVNTTYSAVQTFTTVAIVAPTVGSPTSANVTTYSATLGGTVSADGNATVTARGIVYAKQSDNATPTLGGSGVTTLTDSNGGLGTFTLPTGNVLQPNTTYAYRAYGTNSAGTGYSAVATFTTVTLPANPPAVSSFSPASGPVGTTVIFTGVNFTGATGVTFFRNVPATTFTIVSDTQITAVVPAGTTTGTVRIVSPVGTNTTGTKFAVTP